MKYVIYHGNVKIGKILHGIGEEVELTKEEAEKRSGFVCLPEDFEAMNQIGVSNSEVLSLKTDLQSKDEELAKAKEELEILKKENTGLKISNSKFKTKGDK